MRSQACTKVIDELVRIISSYGLEPDARANTESVYYKMEPNGLLQNFMRIANHAPTVKQMFGNDHQTFPSTEENGNITIYIYDKNIDIANQNAHLNNPNKISDYLNPKYRTEKISANKFRRLENLYQKDSNGNIVFNYTMYIFEVTKLINDNLDSFNQPAVNSIGEEAYNWFMANGVNELIITDDSRVALKDIVRCQGIVRDGSVNEFSSYSKNIDFKMGNLILVDDNGKEVGKKEVILHIEKISSYLLEDFMKLYGNPVSNNFIKRNIIEFIVPSEKMYDYVCSELIKAGFSDGDIVERIPKSNGIYIDIRDNKSKMIFASVVGRIFDMTYDEVCRRYNI